MAKCRKACRACTDVNWGLAGDLSLAVLTVLVLQTLRFVRGPRPLSGDSCSFCWFVGGLPGPLLLRIRAPAALGRQPSELRRRRDSWVFWDTSRSDCSWSWGAPSKDLGSTRVALPRALRGTWPAWLCAQVARGACGRLKSSGSDMPELHVRQPPTPLQPVVATSCSSY